MIKIKKIDQLKRLYELKQQYIEATTAPLDGMWLSGFVPMAQHFGFYKEERLIGYYCVNDEGYLLQFFVCQDFQNQSSFLFDLAIKQNNSSNNKINGAFVSTAEPQYLSLCLDIFSSFKVNSFMYQLNDNFKNEQKRDAILKLIIVIPKQLKEMVNFAKINTGAPEQWLNSYYTNLINRKELFGYWKDSKLLAAGESRGYDKYQKDYADLGFIVNKSFRGKGLGTKVLKQLINITKDKDLMPICSTEKSNIGAQKAINRAGFFASNRIIQFNF